MDDLAFAFGITFPGTTAMHVVTAAIAHAVHIVDKEPFDPNRCYKQVSDELHPEADTVVYPLFIFPDTSVLVHDEKSLLEAMALSRNYLA